TMRRDFDHADACELGQILGRDVRPRLAAITRELDVAIIAAGPDGKRIVRRRRDREDRCVGLDTGLVLCDRTARCAKRLRIVTGQVGTDLRPALALVRGSPEVLRADVQRLWTLAREHDRERPLETLLDVTR